MQTRTAILATFASTTLVTAVARADGMGIWKWDISTNDGDPIVEPGEIATIDLELDFDPDVDGINVTGLSAVIFDVLGGTNAANGHIVDWQVNEDLSFLAGDLTTTDGVSLFNINAGQLTLFGPFSTADPIHVISFQWKPDLIDDYMVQYMTDTQSLEIWEGSFGDNTSVPWTPVEADISFQVFPAPGSVGCALAAAGVMAGRRRPTTPGRAPRP